MAISQELSLERVLQIIVDSVRPLVGARYAALGIPDEHGSMERFITSGLSEERRAVIGRPPRGLGLLGVSLHHGDTVRVEDIAADPRSVGFPADHPPMTTFLSVPVKVEGRAIGNLYLTDRLDGRALQRGRRSGWWSRSPVTPDWPSTTRACTRSCAS